jgi:hypothetical protein
MSLFAKNVGTLDRIVRIVAGVGLLAIAFTGPKSPWGFLGFIPLLTAFMGSCPLYSVLGISSCPVAPKG